MKLTIGTFNLNNLFSRFNFHFRAEQPDLPEGTLELTKIKKLVDSINEKPVTYQGVAMKHKDPEGRAAIIRRIKEMNLDVLAVQEVEDIETLRYFVNHELSNSKPMYPHIILIEGNDPRLIDMAVMSKYPLGKVTTWQHAVHPDVPNERIFSRDLLQVNILSMDRKTKLFTLFNNHLKSHYVPFTKDQHEGAKASNLRRKQQAEMVELFVANEMEATDKFVILGDMNDPVDADCLAPFTKSKQLKLVDGLREAKETRPAPKSSSPPASPLWTHRFKESGKPAEYALFDQIWLSPELAKKQTGAFIDRRTKMAGDGSDHDAAWVEVDISR